MMAAEKDVLLIGYGHPAREDDGIGPAVAEAIEQLNIDGVIQNENIARCDTLIHQVILHSLGIGQVTGSPFRDV